MGKHEPPTDHGRLKLVSSSWAERPPVTPSDKSLLEAFHRGDRGVGQQMYDRLIPVVDGTLYRVLGRRDSEHADLVQAAFEQLVMTLRKGKFAEQCSLAGWATVITCNLALTTLRARVRARKVIDRDAEPDPEWLVASTSPDPERELSNTRQLAAVRAHLASMDEDRTTALLLQVMGYSIEEIAGLTNVSVAAAQSRLSRGRRELRGRLEADNAAHANDMNPRGRDETK